MQFTVTRQPKLIDTETSNWAYLTAPATFVASAVVGLSAETVFRMWANFDNLPALMGSIRSAENVSQDRWRCVCKFGGQPTEHLFVVNELLRDRRIAWSAERGGRLEFALTLERISKNETRVTMRCDFDPDAIDTPCDADTVAYLRGRIALDLERLCASAKPSRTVVLSPRRR